MESRKSLGCELNPQWHLMNMRGTSRQHQENHEQETFENIKNLRFHSDGLCLFFSMHPHRCRNGRGREHHQFCKKREVPARMEERNWEGWRGTSGGSRMMGTPGKWLALKSRPWWASRVFWGNGRRAHG